MVFWRCDELGSFGQDLEPSHPLSHTYCVWMLPNIALEYTFLGTPGTCLFCLYFYNCLTDISVTYIMNDMNIEKSHFAKLNVYQVINGWLTNLKQLYRRAFVNRLFASNLTTVFSVPGVIWLVPGLHLFKAISTLTFTLLFCFARENPEWIINYIYSAHV